MRAPTRVCPTCYAFNPWSADRCQACASTLASNDTLDERLVWALPHPDTATAIRAAGALAARGTASSIEPLTEVAAESGDPYRAAAAAEALAAFPDSSRAQAALERAAHHPSVVVRAAVDRARARRREADTARS